MRLIDADELITAFPCGESVRTESVRATINHMPTIEVSENTAIRIVENECFREDLSKEIKDYLFSDLRHKLYSEQSEISKDCISREWLKKHKEVISYTNEWRETETDEFVSLKNIDNAPSVIPQPKEGEWIDKGYYAECSICGGKSGTQFDGVQPIPLKTKYCPDCGSRMRGADDEA